MSHLFKSVDGWKKFGLQTIRRAMDARFAILRHNHNFIERKMSLITSLRSHKTSCDYLCVCVCNARRPPSITISMLFYCCCCCCCCNNRNKYNCEISPLKWCCIFCNRRLCDRSRAHFVRFQNPYFLFDFIYDFPPDLFHHRCYECFLARSPFNVT